MCVFVYIRRRRLKYSASGIWIHLKKKNYFYLYGIVRGKKKESILGLGSNITNCGKSEVLWVHVGCTFTRIQRIFLPVLRSGLITYVFLQSLWAQAFDSFWISFFRTWTNPPLFSSADPNTPALVAQFLRVLVQPSRPAKLLCRNMEVLWAINLLRPLHGYMTSAPTELYIQWEDFCNDWPMERLRITSLHYIPKQKESVSGVAVEISVST